MGRVVVWVGLAGAGLLLWWPVTTWEGSLGRGERWGVLGYREVWYGHFTPGTATGPEHIHQARVHPDRMGATVALTLCALAVGFVALRALEARSRSALADSAPEPFTYRPGMLGPQVAPEHDIRPVAP